MQLQLKNSFTSLPADTLTENNIRQVKNACFSFVNPTVPKSPSLIHASTEVGGLLGIDNEFVLSKDFLNTFSGSVVYPHSKPYAMCYGGHQFGHWAGQLGDGRAINLFEVSHQNKQWAVQLKGAGKTPYSRSADGLAVLRSSIREYLCSEAMHHLGVPTTRALSLCLSGNMVMRDMLYNGNAAYEKGAIMCRVAPTFIRFGNFEILAAQQDIKTLKKLVDYTSTHFYPEINLSNGAESYLEFYQAVVTKTLTLIIEWERVGFVHGVMNTDNLSILGLTIDYGPYGWLENYDSNWTPNTTDTEKRYCFGNQASIGLWNLVRLANALFPLINHTVALQSILENYQKEYDKQHTTMMLNKLGINNITENSKQLIIKLKQLLEESEMDYTLFFREIIDINLHNLNSFLEILPKISYSTHFNLHFNKWEVWLKKYTTILLKENDNLRKSKMQQINPKYVLRNYMAQIAIEAADKEDYSILNELFELLQKPYENQPHYEKWYALRPDWAKEKIGCSQLSCSS